MSNLNLNSASYRNLDKLTAHRSRVKLGYETYALRQVDNAGVPFFEIEYHGNQIAVVELWRVIVTNCGWDTSTTRNRMSQILRANHIPASTGQQNYVQILSVRRKCGETWQTTEYDTFPNFRIAHFQMISGEWALTHFNGKALPVPAVAA